MRASRLLALVAVCACLIPAGAMTLPAEAWQPVAVPEETVLVIETPEQFSDARENAEVPEALAATEGAAAVVKGIELLLKSDSAEVRHLGAELARTVRLPEAPINWADFKAKPAPERRGERTTAEYLALAQADKIVEYVMEHWQEGDAPVPEASAVAFCDGLVRAGPGAILPLRGGLALLGASSGGATDVGPELEASVTPAEGRAAIATALAAALHTEEGYLSLDGVLMLTAMVENEELLHVVMLGVAPEAGRYTVEGMERHVAAPEKRLAEIRRTDRRAEVLEATRTFAGHMKELRAKMPLLVRMLNDREEVYALVSALLQVINKEDREALKVLATKQAWETVQEAEGTLKDALGDDEGVKAVTLVRVSELEVEKDEAHATVVLKVTTAEGEKEQEVTWDFSRVDGKWKVGEKD